MSDIDAITAGGAATSLKGQADVSVTEKICPDCGITKPASDFHRSRRSKSGLVTYCKPCQRARLADYRSRNPSKSAEWIRKWRAENPHLAKKAWDASYAARAQSEAYKATARRRAEKYRIEHPEKVKSSGEKFRLKNAEKLRDSKAAWYRKNADSVISRVREYRKANAEKSRLWQAAHQARRRVALKRSGGRFTADDVQNLLSMQRGLCAYCGASLSGGYHIDHRVPLSKGGENNRHNLDLLCPRCNLSKGSKLPHEFAQQNGRLL